MLLQGMRLSSSIRKYQNLKQWLFEQAKCVGTIVAHTQSIAGQENYFYFLCLPWIAQPLSREDEELWALRRQQFSQLGFNGDEVFNTLTKILAEDEHLQACCPAPWMLARYFSLEFIDRLALALAFYSPPPDQIDSYYDNFESRTYAESFTKYSVTHINNLDAADHSLTFDEFTIEKFNKAFISKMIGDSSLNTSLFDSKTGEYFFVTKSEQAENFNYEWLYVEKAKAEDFVRLLQYFKDGVVHVGFTFPYFRPEWVNQIRKSGVFYIGDPRRSAYKNGTCFYKIGTEEKEELRKWVSVYNSPLVTNRLLDVRNKFRQATIRAGDHYEASHQHTELTRKLGDLVIALEALFSPSDKGELGFRISLTVAHLLAKDESERRSIFKFTKDMYDRRSKLFHGSYDVNAVSEGRFVSEEEIEKLSSIVRESILRFIILFLKDENSRDEILKKLADGFLSAELSQAVRDESDPNQFLAEKSKTKS